MVSHDMIDRKDLLIKGSFVSLSHVFWNKSETQFWLFLFFQLSSQCSYYLFWIMDIVKSKVTKAYHIKVNHDMIICYIDFNLLLQMNIAKADPTF